jgi:sortase A
MPSGRRLLAAIALALGAALVAPGVAGATTLPTPEPVPAAYDSSRPGAPIGRIRIPAVGVDEVLYDQVTALSIDKGPSHWPGTAMPGQLGNVVIAGHRTSHRSPFLRLGELRPGDDIVFVIGDGTWTYKVTASEVVSPKALDIVNQHEVSEATLFTCHPPGSGSERLVIHALLAPAPAAPVALFVPAAPPAPVYNGRGPHRFI